MLIESTGRQYAVVAGPTLQLDLDASIAASITAPGSAVSQWVDRSSNGYVFAQATGINQPTYPSGTQQNGLDTMLFGNAGATTYLDCGAIPISQRMLVFGVYAIISSGNQDLFDNQTGNDATRITFIGTSATDKAGGFAGTSVVSTTTSMSTTWHVNCLDVNAAASAIYVNGSQESTGNMGSNNMATMRLGCGFGLNVPFKGLLGELKIYTGVVDADVATITTQLRSKWGI